MQPVVRGAVAVACVAALVRIAGWVGAAESGSAPTQVSTSASAARPNPCPPGTLPDGRACVPARMPGARGGQERVVRLPDRASDYGAYRLPVADSLEALVGSSNVGQPELLGPERAGVDLAAQRGAEVRLIRLLGQSGDAEVLEVGNVRGLSVITLHETRSGPYLLLHGELGRTAPRIERGQKLRDGTLLGWVGGSGSPGLVHLYFEARKIREGVDARAEPIARLTQDALSLPTDPRNVLVSAGP